MQESTLIPMTDIPDIAPRVLPATKQTSYAQTATARDKHKWALRQAYGSAPKQEIDHLISGWYSTAILSLGLSSAPKDARTTVFLSSYHEHKRSSYSFVVVHPLPMKVKT